MSRAPFKVVLVLAGSWCALAGAEVPPLPVVTAVPPTGQAPLSSAYRPGNEYADLDAAGYTEKEFYVSGVAPAVTSTGTTMKDGYLLPEDADRVKPIAQAGDFVSDGVGAR